MPKNPRMRVLIITAIYPTPDNPGFGSFVRTQVESLRRAGVRAEVLVLKGRNRKLIYPKGVLQLRNILNWGSFDLVHAHYGFVGMVARTQWKVPVVVTYHGDDLLGTVLEDGKQAWWSSLVVTAGRKLAQHVDAAIVQTREMASKLKKGKAYVIPHEVDFSVFSPTERTQARALLGLNANKKYLLFAANPEIPVKRFPLAKATADWLARRSPSIELLVISREPQERLALYMSACDALVFPSYQEGSPNVVKQAMACNLPIVATDVGDVRQVIGETKGCYVCNPTVTEFAARINEVISPPRRTDGREHIRHFDSATVSERIIEVYERVLRNREKRLADQNRSDVVATAK
jgi:teichuronic acid biosynthesis glycosyltransferase TuaC